MGFGFMTTRTWSTARGGVCEGLWRAVWRGAGASHTLYSSLTRRRGRVAGDVRVCGGVCGGVRGYVRGGRPPIPHPWWLQAREVDAVCMHGTCTCSCTWHMHMAHGHGHGTWRTAHSTQHTAHSTQHTCTCTCMHALVLSRARTLGSLRLEMSGSVSKVEWCMDSRGHTRTC